MHEFSPVVHSGHLTLSGCCPACGELAHYQLTEPPLPATGWQRCERCQTLIQVTIVGWQHDPDASPGQQLVRHLQRSWAAPLTDDASKEGSRNG